MRISAVVGARDEVELIGPVVEHLRAIGVDHIIGADAGSTDGTAEALRAAPDVEFIPYDDTTPGMDKRIGAACLAAARAAGSDWLMFCDADEFWLPATGRLADLAGLGDLDALTVPRFNVPLLPDGPRIAFPAPPARYGDILLYAPAAPPQDWQARVRQDPEAPWIAAVPAEKLLTRTVGVANAGDGGHVAKPEPGRSLRQARAADVVIAHVPFSTEARFARKMGNVARLVAASGHRWGPTSAWHWRRWLDNVESRGGVAGEMARNTVTPDELAELRRAGVVRSAAEVLAAPPRPGAPRPEAGR